MSSSTHFNDTHISVAHGNGSRLMRELIEQLFVKHLKNDLLDTGTDAAIFPLDLAKGELGSERILQELEDDPLPRIC